MPVGPEEREAQLVTRRVDHGGDQHRSPTILHRSGGRRGDRPQQHNLITFGDGAEVGGPSGIEIPAGEEVQQVTHRAQRLALVQCAR